MMLWVEVENKMFVTSYVKLGSGSGDTLQLVFSSPHHKLGKRGEYAQEIPHKSLTHNKYKNKTR